VCSASTLSSTICSTAIRSPACFSRGDAAIGPVSEIPRGLQMPSSRVGLLVALEEGDLS
jgi:hypothetical protein